jgi:hypothetical protein
LRGIRPIGVYSYWLPTSASETCRRFTGFRFSFSLSRQWRPSFRQSVRARPSRR